MQGGRTLLLLLAWVSLATSSYLEFPRVNFEGKFHTDVATNNNERLNFLFASISKEDMLLDGRGSFNQNGTNTWSFVDCEVTSVAYGIDDIKVDREEEPLIGLPLVNNPDTAPAKLVDIDVDDQLLSSVIHGMRLGINYDRFNPKPNSFIGDFRPAVIASDFWMRQAKSGAYYQQRIGTRVVSRIENVTWSEVKSTFQRSTILESFQEALKEEGTSLSIRFTLFNYSKNPSDNWFTYGNVIGSIGLSKEDESLQFPESRVMTFVDNPPLHKKDEDCHTIDDWMHGAYFDIDLKKSTISIDLSNSFAIGVHGNICELYKLYLGITETEGTDIKFKIISEIPYLDEVWYNKKAGIMDFKLDETQADLIKKYSKLVVVTTEGQIEIGKSYERCYNRLISHRETKFSSCSGDGNCACVYKLLEETTCMVRPMDIFIKRMEKDNTAEIRLKMNYFGEKRPDRTIQLHDTSPNGPASETDISYRGKDPRFRSNEIDSKTETATTDANGIATFVFKAGNVGEPRGSIRMDGQVFTFGYCSHDCILPDTTYSINSKVNPCTPTNEGNYLVFLIWSPFTEIRPYFWDKHIEPIFKQYENLYPAMNSIVKLGDYDDVTKPHNVKLISIAMNLPEEHVSYMPVTRDLSPSKRSMILEWLKTPNLPRSWEDIDRKLFETPAYCDVHFLYNVENDTETDSKKADAGPKKASSHSRKKQLAYTLAESAIALQFSQISNVFSAEDQNVPSSDVLQLVEDFEEILPASKIGSSELLWQKCDTKEDLLHSLQTAIALEFSTIPPYMTALYSIKDGFNQEVYSIIRSVVMQEMLHMAQAANILISIGGKPKIENPKESFIPKCFPTQLPGNVLPNLTVRLAKASPQHIRDIFMMIEFPDKIVFDGNMHVGEKTANALTIGAFYSKIEECMEKLDKDDMLPYPVDPETDNFKNQLKWPWNMYDSTSKLYQVKHFKDAQAAIAMIVEQGEGTNQLDPTYLGTQELAHFYKFGEIACKKHLNSSEDHKTYSYKGEDIEFVSEGVWPMRDNPSSKDIPLNTHVYHQAKVFHNMYLSLLNSLQIVFDGKPEELHEAMYVMEAMQIQAKRLMQMKIPAPDGHVQTCGLIFDYEWRDPSCGLAPLINERK